NVTGVQTCALPIFSKEERNRTAEFIFTKPFTRKDIITSMIIAAIVNVVVITLITLIGNLIMLVTKIEGGSILSEIATSLLSMFNVQILFFFLGLLVSAVFSICGIALFFSAVFVAFSYFLMIIIKLIGSIDFLSVLTPFMYFTGTGLVENGISVLYILITVVITVTAGYLTYYKHKRRDLHS